MKKILVSLAVLMMVGCENLYIDSKVYEYIGEGFELFTPYDVQEIVITDNKLDQAWHIGKYINYRVFYKTDSEGEVWRSPEETLLLGYGDCEDFAILFMNLWYITTGEKAELVLVDHTKMDNRSIEEGGRIDHAIVRLEDGTLWEPRSGKAVTAPVGYSYTFNEIFK